jgi:quinoprotein glucose dehydrogenase
LNLRKDQSFENTMNIVKPFITFLLTIVIYCGCQPDPFPIVIESEHFSSWEVVGGDAGVTHYSNLTQINKENVKNLKLGWEFSTGDILNDDNEYWGGSTIQSNPIVVNGLMYSTTPTLHVIALDAATGKQIWRFDPWNGQQGGGYNRGVAYWENGDKKHIYYTVKNELICLDALTGELVASFGNLGRKNMAEGLIPEHASRGGVISPAAPVIYKDLVVIGGMGEWRVPGNISAYDAITGDRVWIFHTIPFPGETGFETWGDTTYWRDGFGANSWGGLSVDEENEMIFFALGQAKPDLHRPNSAGDHLFGNSLVAVNANNGAYKWHFQEIHHDLWDLDLPCAPMLIDWVVDGEIIQGLAQLSKTGNTFLFDRIAGKNYTVYKEKKVPPSKLVGEYASATQPWVKWPEPFSYQSVSYFDYSNISAEAEAFSKERLQNADLDWMTPPSLRGNIYYGVHGGAEWPGGAFDPEMQYLFINANQTPWYIKMRRADIDNTGAELYSSEGCNSCHGWNRGGVADIPALTEINQRYPTVKSLEQKLHQRMKTEEDYPKMTDQQITSIAQFLMDSIPLAQNHPGGLLFAGGKCVECHGANRQGTGIGETAIPSLVNLEYKYSDIEGVKKIIKNGRNAMPSNEGYSDEELTLIAQFLLNVPAKSGGVELQGPTYQTDRFERFLDAEGYPATKPPWGIMNAIDLKTGKIAWKVPLGEYQELLDRGLPPTGTENFGGPVVTKGGLVFIAATMDEKIRAFDKHTGEILWEYQLPAGGYTTPSTYLVNGNQYLVIPCGGGGKPGTKSGDKFLAFALP